VKQPKQVMGSFMEWRQCAALPQAASISRLTTCWLTALLVVAACLVLGMLRPRWPWRWVIVVGIFLPLSELGAYKILAIRPSLAQIYASFLAVFPGFAGAYGGAVLRRVVENLRQGT